MLNAVREFAIFCGLNLCLGLSVFAQSVHHPQKSLIDESVDFDSESEDLSKTPESQVRFTLASNNAETASVTNADKQAKAGSIEYLPTDSRLWSHCRQAIMFADFSKALPVAALTSGHREKGKWKVLPYSTTDLKGNAISTYSFTGASPVTLPLDTKGWHAVYVGVCTVSTGFKEAKNGLQVKLSSESVFKRIANNMALQPNRVDVIEEEFLTVASLDGQSIEFAPLPNLPATICYVKLVPLSDQEIAAYTSEKADAAQSPARTSIATFDGHSWIWPYEPKTVDDLLASLHGFENSDIGKWWFQVLGADLVIYPSKVGNMPGEYTVDFPTAAHASFTHSLKGLWANGINPLKVARDEARRQGVEFHVMLRPAGWKAAIPYEETFNSKFFDEHPEWRCIDRDGTPTMYMSYACPQVRQHLLEIFRETLELEPDGVGFLFNRGMPMILWEDAFCERFEQVYNADARQVAEDDHRILSMRSTIMTEFMQEIRRLLDETADKQGRTNRYKISLGTFSKEEDNQKFGFDLPHWIQKGLVDELGVAWFAHHTSFAQPDMAYYKKLTAGSKVGVYPFVISWKPGKPQELCKKVTAFYNGGAAGIAIWDPSVEVGWTETQHGNVFDVLSRLGQRDLIAKWAEKGVPLPHSIPLTRLDENYYSRWFPTTGF